MAADELPPTMLMPPPIAPEFPSPPKIDTAPLAALLVSAPPNNAIAPPTVDVDDPLKTDIAPSFLDTKPMLPDDPHEDVPDEKSILPLTPPTPAFAVCKVIAPEDDIELLPEAILNAPPVFVVTEPLVTSTFAPSAFFAKPTFTPIFPATSVVLSPVCTSMTPESPELLVPDLINICPLTPLLPALAENTNTPPLVLYVLLPLCTIFGDIIIPPLGPDASPDFMYTSPLAAPLALPENIDIFPDEPSDVVPDEKLSLPETPLVPELLVSMTMYPLEVASLDPPV